ncbi:MAG: hypothetical protein ABIQ81_04780 [Novosphingobium sp.]
MPSSSAVTHFVIGDSTGLRVPAHGEALHRAGAAYLTEAFRAFGALAPDNSVTRIARLVPCPGGSTGQKFFMDVEYARPDPGLHTELFVKFSRDFADPVRDARGKHELAGEVQFAAVSREADFPITVPVAYFADYQQATHTGVLITQQIPFGRKGIEPHRAKCTDDDLDNPIDYYRVIIRSLARVAAAHVSGRLSASIARRFPFDPVASVASCTIPYDSNELEARLAVFAEFVARAPQLFPVNITAELFADIAGYAGRFVKHQAKVRAFLAGNPDLIALCHWNANLDNAWFWRDDADVLHCGLMDWGHAGQLNLAFSLWGCLSGACLEVWDHHLGELIDLFIEELAANGGPRLTHDALALHLDLYVAMMGLSYFIDSPARIQERFPAALQATGPLDPIFRTNDTARNQLHIATAFLNLWQRRDFGGSLDRALAHAK